MNIPKTEPYNTIERNKEKKQYILIFPRTPKQWLLTGVSIVLFACIAFLSITGIRSAIGSPSDMSFAEGFLVTLMYTTIIILLQSVTVEGINRIMPVNSIFSAIIHIVIQSASVAIAFFIAQRLEFLLFGDCVVSPENTGIPLLISFLLSFIGNTAYYISYFYKQAKIAQQMVIVSELSALRAQINPHFLFNTLNSIAALIRINPDEAETVTEYLADLFRYSLRASKKTMVSLEEEISSVNIYLSIEKARFRERLHIHIQMPEYLKKAAVPSLLLQPLVENSIKHGANVIEGNFTINVICSSHEGIITIRVEDSGNGFDISDAEAIFSKGTGLSNVKDRLTLLFPKKSALRFEKNAIIIIFPFSLESDHPFMKMAEHNYSLSS